MLRVTKGNLTHVTDADHDPGEFVVPGGYLCSERDLYRIEELRARSAVIEDCRTGVLFDVSMDDLRRLKPVRGPG